MRHPGQEFNYVLEGTVMVVVEGHEVVLSPETPSISTRVMATA